MQTDYFELFGLPAKFDVDENLLRQTWHRLQLESHPDQFVAATKAAQIDAMQQSVLINTAYKTLAEPVARAWYLITRTGQEVEALKRHPLDHQFFEQLIQWRESITELTPEAKSVATIDPLRRDLNTRRVALINELESLFNQPHDNDHTGRTDHNDGADADHNDSTINTVIDALVDRILRLQFIEKTRAELKEAEARLLDEM